MIARILVSVSVLTFAVAGFGVKRVAAAIDESPLAATACTFPGTWSGTYSCAPLRGKGYVWIIRADGTATGTIDGRMVVQQKWSAAGTQLSITDAAGQCSAVGTYTTTFEADCNTMKLARISDTCPGRGDCVDGLTVTRQH